MIYFIGLFVFIFLFLIENSEQTQPETTIIAGILSKCNQENRKHLKCDIARWRISEDQTWHVLDFSTRTEAIFYIYGKI